MKVATKFFWVSIFLMVIFRCSREKIASTAKEKTCVEDLSRMRISIPFQPDNRKPRITWEEKRKRVEKFQGFVRKVQTVLKNEKKISALSPFMKETFEYIDFSYSNLKMNNYKIGIDKLEEVDKLFSYQKVLSLMTTDPIIRASCARYKDRSKSNSSNELRFRFIYDDLQEEWRIDMLGLFFIDDYSFSSLCRESSQITSEETFAHAKESTELSYIEVFDRDLSFQGIINGLFRVMHKSEDIASILTYADTKFTFKTYSCLGKKDMQIRYDTSEASKKELQEKLNLVIGYETFFNILKTVRTYINSEAYEKVYPFKSFPIVTLPASSLEHEKINISYSGNLVSLTTPHPLDNYSNIDIDFHFDKNLDTWKISNFICQVHDGISFTPENTIIDWAEKRKRVKQLENKKKKIILFLENQTIKNKFKTSNSSFSEKELDVLGRNNTETETKKILTLLKNEKMEIRASEAFIHVDNAKNKTNSLIGFIYDNQTEEWKLYTIE